MSTCDLCGNRTNAKPDTGFGPQIVCGTCRAEIRREHAAERRLFRKGLL